MKGFFVLILATAIVSVTLADSNFKPIWQLQQEQNVFPQPRIIQGLPAANGQFPYQIHLTIRSATGVVGYCGGSIISNQWVLTAAHCTAYKSLLGINVNYFAFDVKAGSVNVNAPEQTRSVILTDIHTHPNYNEDSLMNDISLLRTLTPFDLTANVGAALLAPSNINLADYVGQFVTVSGFGYTSNSGPISSLLLYTNNLQIISRATCIVQYGYLPTTTFCCEDTISPISASCSGDSGGPVTMMMAGQPRQIGLVSFGHRNGCDRAAKGFTDVVQFIPWIQQVTGLIL